jgi:protein-S-isoprenylcysteine O-methyltransferase Ste14
MNQRPNSNDPHPSFFKKGGGWVLAQFSIMAAWLVLTPIGHTVTSSPWLWIPAISLIGSGAAAGIAGTLVLGRNRTPFPKPRTDSHLVQTGIYALVRHPLYASLIALSLGWASLWGSGLGAALAVVQALFLDAKAQREERWLHQQFPEYAVYAAKVKRFIPWVY